MSPSLKLLDGSEIPSLAYGTGTALFGKDCANAIKLAIDCGFTHLDGAQIYNNEDSLGAGIKAAGKPRSELYIVTKLKPGLGGAQVKPSLVESLQKLGVDYVDLFLVHSPRPNKAPAPGDKPIDLVELWQAMEAVQAEGLAKSIGVSNFGLEDLKTIVPGAKVVPSVNQIELHPYIWKAAEPVVKYCLEHGITPESYGGLSPLVRAPGGPVDEVLPAIEERLGKELGRPVTSSQVLSKWISQKGAIVVTTSSKEARIKEYLAVTGVPDLTPEELEAIEAAGAKLPKRFFMRAVYGE
ncbi:NADP-dependent oxidoreductase domain-containing protein [Mycena galericulata]|nr:NADP-dependent oxidoreductase domain-containing protein [Mycena galericulata]